LRNSYTARWILPIAGAPIRNGSVTIEQGRIAAVGADRQDARDLGDAAILPALVNAHTHLELSHLHGRVPSSGRFDLWIRALMALRREHPDPEAPGIVEAARTAIRRARACGTGLVGDVSNTLVTIPLLREAGMPARVFYELLGFREVDAAARVTAARARADALEAGDVRVTLAPHAPYSVSPPLFKAIRADVDARPGAVSSVHLGESAEEVEFIRHGTGPIRATLEELGVWTDEWRPVLPAGTSPVEYLSELGFLDRSIVVVHGVQFDGADLTRLAALGVTIAACPRSNRHVGVGSPPLEAFYAMNVDVAFGTDSLASVDDLSLFAELAEARRIAPRVPARRLLRSATLSGATALGFGDRMGSIERGKRAALIAVAVPPAVDDVEEYLVSGVEPAAVTWIAGAPDAGSAHIAAPGRGNR
jgi:cytosine/adenosine deaminase-related metal-dependent hydrolase